MTSLLEQALQLSSTIIAHRRYLHQHPEVGMALENTRDYVAAQLRRMGYQPQEVAGGSLVAQISGPRPGRTFLLRADMDALPIREETGLPFAAQNGRMHACGHDCHTAMLLGAAQLLRERQAQVQGTVKLLFQAGEETMEGARAFVESGGLEGVDGAMMLHVIAGAQFSSGVVGVFGGGPSYASSDWFRIRIQGTGGHGAAPESTHSPLSAAAHILCAIQEIMSDKIAAATNAVMTVGEIHGGEAPNVIPDTAYMTGTIRTFHPQVRQALRERLTRTAALTAQARDCEARVEFTASTPCLICDPEVSATVLEGLQALLGPEGAVDLRSAKGGAYALLSSSEDFAYLAEKVPSSVLSYYLGSAQEGYCYPAHHPRCDYREDLLYRGAAAYAQAAMWWLERNPRSNP